MEMADQAPEHFIPALSNLNEAVSGYAMRLLGISSDGDVLPFLTGTLEAGTPSARRAAAIVIGEMADSSGLPFLVEALRDPDAETRANAVWSMGQMWDAGSIHGLISALSDDDETVRANAALVLGMKGRTTARPNNNAFQHRLAGLKDYEGVLIRFADRVLARETDLVNVSIIGSDIFGWKFPAMGESNTQAMTLGIIEFEEANDLEMAGIVLSGRTPEGGARYIVAETSITVQKRDVTAARRRAEILQRFSNITTIPAVFGVLITGEARAEAPEGDVLFVQYNPGGQFSPALGQVEG